EDLTPIRLSGSCHRAVHRSDGRINLIKPSLVSSQTPTDQILSLFDQRLIPQKPVLIGQQYKRLPKRRARRATRMREQQQGQQAEHFRLVEHKFGEHADEPDRLVTQVQPEQAVAVSHDMALVEDE